MVVANAVAALSEINESSPTGMYRLLHYRQYSHRFKYNFSYFYHLTSQNQTKNIPVVLPIFPIKL